MYQYSTYSFIITYNYLIINSTNAFSLYCRDI